MALAAILAVLALAACSYWLGAVREAHCPAGQAQAVLTALRGDGSLAVTVVSPPSGVRQDSAAELRCTRGGRTALVLVPRGADRIRVSVGFPNGRPTDDEIRACTALAESICDRLDAQVPGIGPWEARDEFLTPSERHGGAMILAAGFVGALALLFGIQFAQVRRRRRAAALRRTS